MQRSYLRRHNTGAFGSLSREVFLTNLAASHPKRRQRGLESADPGLFGGTSPTTIAELAGVFASPPGEFRSMPLWNWNTDVTRERIDRDLADFKSQGFGGVFIHPRRGMVQAYLSDAYMALWRYAMERAGQLGLFVWIYDENTYPSGFAGGLVQEQMPESYERPQGLKMAVSKGFPDDIGDYAVCLRAEGGRFVEAAGTGGPKADPDGDHYLFSYAYQPKVPKYNGFSWVDLLTDGVTETFIDITMTRHEAVAGEAFGRIVPGVFSDEPHIGPPPGAVRWWPGLFEAFARRWGYDLKVHLPSLFERVGDWRRVRHNYFQTLLERYIERWSGPYQAYCRKKGLLWTGHYWEHTWPNIDLSIDDMALYEWHDVPGIDMLFGGFDDRNTDAQFGNVRAVKEAASVVNQMGRKRLLCETYGGSGWELTFEQAKRFGDWTYVLGVDFMNQHLSFMSLAGTTKYDHPPAFSHQEPWWGYYKTLNDYYARLSAALSAGRAVNRILVLEPNTTMWMYVTSGLVDALAGPQRSTDFAENDLLNERATAFQAFVTGLSRVQIEYDLGSEAVIRNQGRIEGAEFVVGQCAYHTVVIPPGTENLNTETFSLLERFIGNGGMVLLYSRPGRLDGAENAAVSALLDANKPNVIDVKADDTSLLNSDDFRISDLRGGYLLSRRRRLDDGQVVFLANSSLTESVCGTLAVKGGAAAALDLFSGAMRGVEHRVSEGMVSAPFELAPGGSLLLSITESPQGEMMNAAPVRRWAPVHSDASVTASRVGDNVLVLNYCDLTVNGRTHRHRYVLEAGRLAYEAHGFKAGNPWGAIQLRDSIVKHEFGEGTGFEAHYSFVIDGDADAAGMKAAAEKPHVWAVSVNGHPIQPDQDKHWLDRSFGVYSIESFVVKGRNTLTLRVSPMSVHAEIEPVYVLGNFSVLPAQDGWRISPAASLETGSWRSQGLPFYADGVRYEKTFIVGEPEPAYAVELKRWAGTAAEVFVNDVPAGIIAFAPYRLDVSGLIRSGVNRIGVKVVGSLHNTLGPFFMETGGIAGPNKWQTAPDAAVSEHYRLKDYGLFEEMVLLCEKAEIV